MRAIKSFIGRIRKKGKKRPTTVKTVAMGRAREFEAWDVGDDTYIFEVGIQGHLDERARCRAA